MRTTLPPVLLALAVAVAAGFGLSGVVLGVPLVTALAAFFLLLLPYFFFGLAEPRPPVPLPYAAALVLPYLLYGWGTGTFEGQALLRIVVYVGVPAILVALAIRRSRPGVLDLVAVLAIWLPFDLRLLEGIWEWPEGQGSYGFQTILAVDLAVLLFVLARRIEGVGYRFTLERSQALTVLVSFSLFSLIAIPLGLSIDFISYHPRAFDVLGFAGSFLAILLFIGIPEELLFRGLIQNFFEQWWGKNAWTLLFASVVFGAAHLDNDQAPNFAYGLMASVAGVFYGLAFRRSGTLLAPAIVHALVDAVWRQLFR